MTKQVLVVASTFPASADDGIPAFVRDLVVALKNHNPNISYGVLAPHYQANTNGYVKHDEFDEYRFNYFRPKGLQCLTGAGIMPTIARNRFLYILVPFFFLGEFFALLKLTRRIGPDVIYAHWFTPQGVTAALVSMITGVPWILTTHASDVSVLARLSFIGPWIVRRLFPRATAITAVSTQTLKRARAFFSDQEWTEIEPRTRIIPMGVPDVFHQEIIRWQCGSCPANQSKQVLFVGRLVTKKGVDLLLKAFSRAMRECDQLIVAGHGPELAELQATASALGIADSVKFLGFVSGGRKLDAFRNADVIVVPSIESQYGDVEGLPVVILEALAAGKVCIASDVTGAADVVVHGTNGFLVPNNDLDALAETLHEVLSASEKQLKAISIRARASSTALRWSAVAKLHHDFLFGTAGKNNS